MLNLPASIRQGAISSCNLANISVPRSMHEAQRLQQRFNLMFVDHLHDQLTIPDDLIQRRADIMA